MAIAIVTDFTGGTLDQYDQALAKLNFTPGGQGAPGGLFHWVSVTDTGIRTTDVWTTQELADAFTRDSLAPTITELGLPEPTMTVHEVHNYLTAGPSA